MIYHALRLACITFSSIKTWSAVVDSSDRSRARRHMFLWFLTLAGLAVEPIADSILSSRIPMYEGIKIMFAGWLLLAHFDISRPQKQPRKNYTIPEDHLRQQLDTQHVHPAISRQSSYLSTTERISTAVQGRSNKADDAVSNGSTVLRANNLDFGRFKRDLERRRSHSRTHSHVTEEPLPTIPSRTNSRLSHIEPSSSASKYHPRDESYFPPKSTEVLRAASLPRGPGSRVSTPTATGASQHQHVITPLQDSSATHSEKRSPLDFFLFGNEKSSRKRPSSAMSEERPSPSLARNPSNLSSRSQPRPSALQRQRSGGEHRVRINAESPGGKNKRQRQSPDDKEKFAELEEEDERSNVRHTKKDSQSSGNTKAEPKRSNAATSASTPTPTPNAASTSASSTKFSRTKPPAKSRASLPPNPSKSTSTAPKDNRPQHQSAPESTGQDLFSPSATETAEEPPQVVSASFESRMKNVRAWIKGRNPSMISPTLTATSEATATQHSQLKRRSSSFLKDEKSRTGKSGGGGSGGLDDLPKVTKRKAARQLAPSTNTKRWAAEDEQERPSQWTVVEEDRIPQQSSSSSRRKRSGDQATLDSVVPTTDRNRGARDYSFSQPAPIVRQNSTTRISDDRNRPSSLPTNVDWDRFQKMIGATGSRRPSSSSSAANARQKYTGKSSIATLLERHHHHHDDGPQDESPTLAPLIKLRQSQLKQHQQEDFFGVKKKEAGERRTKFDSTLDLWEQDDDETLARNAAREAEDVEARSQLLSQARRDASSSEEEELGSSTKDERGLFTFTSPSRASRTAATALEAEYEMAAPTPSLLRIIPFNGESSRRPVPDFLPKKSSSALFHETNIKSSPSRRASQPGHDSSNPFLEKTPGSGGGSSSTGGRIAPPPPPRFNFNFAGAASLAKKRAQSHATQTPQHHHHHHHQQAKASPEEVAARRERHPGLYTPSKKKATSAAEQGSSLWKESHLSRPTASSPFKQQQRQQPSTPTTMSRYIEFSSLSDDNE